MPFWSRRPPEEPPSWEEMFPLEALLRSQLDDVLIVQERRLLGRSLAFGGPPPRGARALAVERLRPRLARHGYAPFLREDQGTVWVHALAQAEVAEPSRPLVHLALFLATVVTTLLAGTLALGGVSARANCGSTRAGSPWAYRSPWRSSGSSASTSSATTPSVACTGCRSPCRTSFRFLHRSSWGHSARSSGSVARSATAGRCSTWQWRGRSPAWWSRFPCTCSASSCRPWFGSPRGRPREPSCSSATPCCRSSSSG